MKKIFAAAFLALTLCGISLGADITSIRNSISSEKIRIVVDLSGSAAYTSSSDPTGTTVSLNGCSAAPEVLSYRILDAMIDRISFSRSGDDLNMEIVTAYPVKSTVFDLKDPFRIVIDLSRINPASPEISSVIAEPSTAESAAPEKKPATTLITTENVAYGVSLFKVNTGTDIKSLKGFSLLVDPSRAEVLPVISVPYIKGKDGTNIFGALFGFLGGGEETQRYSHFAKKRVLNFVKMADAVAGINGSFFYGNGTPVGALVVNGQVISSPHLNRTALIMYRNGESVIDSLKMEGYLKLKGNDMLSFSGVNQPMNRDGIMVYTPDYQTTDPSGTTTNIIVVNGSVEGITYGETKIPRNGFVVSASGTAGEAIKDRMKKGDSVKLFFLTTPPLNEVAHVIAGGPRLILDGQKYITSIEEKFRNDVAKSRAARTAVGITKDGKLMFVVIESSGTRKGATLDELAGLMLELGAYNAMNLDGGGSSTMVVKGRTLNEGAGRPVSNAIVVKAGSYISKPQ